MSAAGARQAEMATWSAVHVGEFQQLSRDSDDRNQAAWEVWSNNDLVFCKVDGETFNPDRFSREFTCQIERWSGT